MGETKRPDQCLFCTSRRCQERVVAKDGSYDEIACGQHIKDLHKHSDAVIPGKMRVFMSGTAYYRRGVPVAY